MEAIVLDRITPRLSMDGLRRRLHVSEGSAQDAELRALVREAEAIGRPKALGGVAYIDERGDDYVVVDGVRFGSRVLAVNLAETHRVFPFIATCGVELEAWAASLDDVLHRYWSEAIREAALNCATEALVEHVEATFHPGKLARMNPGSLPDWPIEEQIPLFRLLGDPEATIGVSLTPSMLMVPSKTVSGLRFGGAGSFESCMLCPRAVCPNRRAPYDPALYADKYALRPA